MSKRLEKYTIAYVCEVIYRWYSGLVEPILNAVCYDDGGWVGNAEEACHAGMLSLAPSASWPL